MNNQFKILAIDDERVVLDSIVKLCGAEGWRVNDVIDASIGLKILEEKSYNLIICDIMMPGMDGFEFMERLRKNDIKTPVIITTGFATVENAVRSLQSGAIDFLPKPFTFDELISCVGRGLKYSEIQGLISNMPIDSDSVDDTVVYIPCPPKYKRLGFSSWTFQDEDGTIKIGLTDLLLRTIDSIEKIELNNIDDEIIQGITCYQINTEDQLTHNILAPVSGRIIKRNEMVVNDHTLVEKDPYFRGWIYTIVPDNLAHEEQHLVPCSSDMI